MIPTPSKNDEDAEFLRSIIFPEGSAPAHNCSMAWWFSLVPVTQYHPARKFRVLNWRKNAASPAPDKRDDIG